MSWRALFFSFKNKVPIHLDRFTWKGKPALKKLPRLVMEPARKKQKFVPEECELIIDIDLKGACNFNVVSKVESVCKDHVLNLSDNTDKVGKAYEELLTSCGEVASETEEDTDHENHCKPKNEGQKGQKLVNNKEHCDEIDSTEEQSSSNYSVNKALEVNQDVTDVSLSLPPTSQYVSLDCEFVGVSGDRSALGRCSIVDFDGHVLCDIYARPLEAIFTYRTRWSGITRAHMKKAIPIESALSQIHDIIKDKIVIGHGIHNDFKVLGFGHPRHLIRDTQKCKHLNARMKMKPPISLKNMADKLLGIKIQAGAHCSVIDAHAAMELFKLVRVEWETSLLQDGDQSNSPDDPDQTANDSDEVLNISAEQGETSGDLCESSLSKDSADKMKSLHQIQNGKISKSKKRREKLKRAKFRLLSGAKKLADYFNDGNKELNNGEASDNTPKWVQSRTAQASLKAHYDQNVKNLLSDKYWLDEKAKQAYLQSKSNVLAFLNKVNGDLL